MTPNGATARPSFISMPGMIVCIGRLPGPTLFGWPPSVRNDRPRLCSSTPHSGARIPEPNPWKIELISDSALPSRSTTQR